MRQKDNQSLRTQAVESASEVDYHEFAHSGLWLFDIDIAGELCDCPRDMALMRQQLARN